jgi:hypothetical protein
MQDLLTILETARPSLSKGQKLIADYIRNHYDKAAYMTAAKLGKRALAICSISDSLVTGEELDAEARQNTFTTMMEIALKTAVAMDKK